MKNILLSYKRKKEKKKEKFCYKSSKSKEFMIKNLMNWKNKSKKQSMSGKLVYKFTNTKI